ncbi:hypothetical protein BH09PSE1_BH09PSE1_27470 [soil metagenome]
MTVRTAPTLTLLTALGGSLFLAGAALAQTTGAQTTGTPAAQTPTAQETPAQARARAATSSLNGGPAQTTLAPRPNAQPPLAPAERPRPVVPVRPQAAPPAVAQTAPPVRATQQPVRPPVAAPPVQARTQTPARPQTTPTAPTSTAAQAQTRAAGPSVTLTPGQTQPAPIPMPLGYYVRGDKACNQVWPGEGDLAWFTPTSFTIDFGGCESGQFLQTGLNSWSEEQHCMTELGGDAGVYSVTYEVIGTGTVLRRAHLAIDDRIEQDLWAHCETSDVPEQARFKS